MDANAKLQDESLRVLQSQPWEVKEPAMNLLQKLIGNVAGDPNNEKFKKLRADNPKLKACLWSVPGCTDFMLAAGFEWVHTGGPENRFCVLRSREHLANALERVRHFVEAETQKQWRHDRDVRIAMAKADEAEINKFRRGRLSPELQRYAQERDSTKVPNSAMHAPMEDLAELKIVLQTLTQATRMMVSRHTTVGDLRGKTARLMKCHAEQVILTLVVDSKEGMKLRENHRKLDECGFVDGCSVMVSIREADEIYHHIGTQRSLSCSVVTSPLLDALAAVMSWRFTQELLDAALARNLIVEEQLRQFKCCMHGGECSQKEVRDQVIALVGGDNIQDIIDKYISSESGVCQLVKRVNQLDVEVERNRHYAETIAADNQRGLMMR